MSSASPKILFVDDDATNRQSLGWLLREAGYSVLEAGTGEEALRLAQERPDVVLLDVSLPDMDGFEVCRQLRALPATRHAAVVQCSAIFVGSGDRSAGLEQGADAYLVKPVEPRELLAHVQALLRVRAAEEASRLAAQEWRTTFDAIGEAVCLLDTQGRIRRCNRALADLVGLDFPGLLGRSLDEVLCEGLSLAEPPSLARQLSGERVEVPLGERWFRVTAHGIRDDHQTVAGTVLILHDVTTRVRLEEQLRQSQRLEAIGRLAGGVAHDFNNLLTAILGNASLLLRLLPSGEPEAELTRTIERSAWRAAELTRQLLGFSRQALLWLEPTDPGVLLVQGADAVRKVLPTAIRLVVDRPQELWAIQGDPVHLGQVLAHLCSNATDAMPAGGVLTLSARNVALDEEARSLHPDGRVGEFVCLSVQDTGTGIAAELIGKIFDPFFTTKPTGRGSGLGLAMVHGIVKQHQGWVECHSEPGRGARFDLYFPRHVVGRAAPAPASGGGRVVLIADEDDTLRALSAAYLRQGGFEVLAASDGREAIEVYRREHQRIDLVVLDQTMTRPPASETLERMREVNASVHALLMGANREAGALAQPDRQRELLQAVHAMLLGR